MNGILIVDKPAGWTSHDVVAKLRGALKTKRIGHGGTLDPMATGVLPVFVGNATRAAEFCENAEKEYIAGLRLGVVTDTQDITGRILEESGATASAEALADALQNFIGALKQTPPMYSAIKQSGKKLYELARRGVEVPRQPRDIFVYAIELLGGDGHEFLLRVVCSKGTYIRTLCHDVGAALGCGGTMSSLRRTRAGAYTIEMAQTLEAILATASSSGVDSPGGADSLLLPVDSIFSEYPPVTLTADDTRILKNGAASLPCKLTDGKYRFYGPDNEFLLPGSVINTKSR